MPEPPVATLIRQSDFADKTVPATLLVLGAFVLLLSAGWRPLRAAFLMLPAALARRLPNPASASAVMTDFSPREIVSELDRFIVGQDDAKRAVAVALRNRWRRLQLDDELRDEVTPKNILMIGPTGVGKTEISRRLARLADAPFLKVEATKFTEVGYVGRDVEQIVRDLVEIAIALDAREASARTCRRAPTTRPRSACSTRWSAPSASAATRETFRKKLRAGELDDKEIEIEVQARAAACRCSKFPACRARRWARSRSATCSARLGGSDQDAARRPSKDPYELLIAEEADKLLDQDALVQEAIDAVENNGIVFLDEIDKIAARDGRGADVSREGVQRDLLPLIEGTTVSTKYGAVKTDHILFIASGAFHVAKPSDLLPELQGRLPIRVELKALTEDDFAPHPDRDRSAR